MKILYATEAILDNWSAPAVHIDEICRNMAELGNSVTLYYPTAPVFASVQGYKTIAIKAPRTFHSVFYQPVLFARLFRDMLRDRPDIIYSRHSHLMLVPGIIGRIFGIPVTLEVNERLNTDATFHHDLLAYIMRTFKIFNLIEAINFRLATRMIAVTEGIRQHTIEDYGIAPSKVATVANGVNTDRFKPIAIDRASFSLREGDVHVGYIGSFLAWQGLKDIARAAKLLSASHPRIIFTFIGGGTDEAYLRSFVKENGLEATVRVLPPVPHSEVPANINSFDICLSYPIKLRAGITSPFKVYEYLSCGRPVISSDIPGMREEFGDIVEYADPESPESLAKAIASLAGNAEKLKRMGAASREFVLNGHSWSKVAERILAICAADAAAKRKNR